jgi:hypothetical protein
MILTHESGAQEDQFDGKKEGQKSHGTIRLRWWFYPNEYPIPAPLDQNSWDFDRNIKGNTQLKKAGY